MSRQSFVKQSPEQHGNGCLLVKPSEETQLLDFCSDVLYLNEKIQVGLEFNWDIRVRIDGVITTDEESFIQMMDAVVVIAKRFQYPKLFFADSLKDEVLEMFLNYGFVETAVMGDPYNHYLDFDIEKSKGVSIWQEVV